MVNRAPASSANVSKLKRVPDRRPPAGHVVMPRRCHVVAFARDCRPAYNRPTVPHAHERTRGPALACFAQLAAT
ncbi:hypothetical protein WT01_35820 [Burkholderia cepacia]|uniref:Uncharacterized protein n=1 Tax=Burkholderia cepacia TaxID=292 RepID=A0A103Z7L4_BURCE|nr:hypothetical protein WS90_27285 [Burkholderia cepacia]KVL00084.1 hypothetical protein WS93_15630 [Burkholderia cepacia]KVL46451.1 hypothetical protein WT01_35820 [Burkholderia cepacia]